METKISKKLVEIFGNVRLFTRKHTHDPEDTMTDEGRQRQDTPLIKQLILYICQKGRDFESFGMIHLNKILYAADFEFLRETGKTITGATYKKQRHGAVAACIKPILDEMIEAKELRIRTRLHYTRLQKKPINGINPVTDSIPNQVRSIVDRWINELGPLNAKQVEKKFHDQAYWRILKQGDTVPYGSVFWPDRHDRSVTDEDRKIAYRIRSKRKVTPATRPAR